MIDWGWFYFMTKPIFYRRWTGSIELVGNFGLAILLLTVLVKLAVLPARQQVLRVHGKMKKLQPEMEQLKERFNDDKVKQQQEMMELYKKEKINPMAGCLPIADADPGLLRALQGAVRHHRDAPCAVLRLDPGSVRARSDQRCSTCSG